MDQPLERKYLKPEDLRLCNGKRVVLDTETTGLQWYKEHIIGLAVYCSDANIWGYIKADDDRQRQEIYEEVSKLIPGTTIIMHNAKFDLHMLGADHVKSDWQLVDTIVLAHLIDSRQKKSLKDLEQKYLGSSEKEGYIDLVSSVDRRIKNKVWLWPEPIRFNYACNDVLATWRLAELFVPQVVHDGMWRLFEKDMVYLDKIRKLERLGMQLDQEFCKISFAGITEALSVMEQQLWDATGQKFNWRSPQQLSRAIYEGMGISKPINPFLGADGVDHSKFAGRDYNATMTKSMILAEKAHHPLAELIISMREAQKFLRSYLHAWEDLKDDNGILHSNYNLTGTRTGRLSSGKPNLQNVPSDIRGRAFTGAYSGRQEAIERTDVYNLRNALIARPGKEFVSIDYKQMEMRMFGIVSGDPFMLDALRAGKDVHSEIAMKVWGVADEIHRNWSKMITFGLIYGMTTGSLRFKLNMTHEQAIAITSQYWAEFPRIQPWIEDTIEVCRQQGYVEYWSGRRWYEDDPSAYYKGANALIQGGCADLLSVATIRVDDWLQTQGSEFNLVHTVHDELISEVPIEAVPDVIEHQGDLMTVPDIFEGVPFKTDAKHGPTYGSLGKMAGKNATDIKIPVSTTAFLQEALPESMTALENQLEELGDEEEDDAN